MINFLLNALIQFLWKATLLMLLFIGVVACTKDGVIDWSQLSGGAVAQTPLPPVEQRAALCDFARRGLGLPIKIDPQLRSEAYAAFTRPNTLELLRPVARTNNAFRCVCGTPEERVRAKC